MPVKNTEQQDLCILHNIRQSTVEQRVALSNQIRGLASEYGVTFGQRKYAFRQQLPQALEDASNGLTIIARQTLNKLYEQWLDALEREVEIEQSIVAISAKSPAYELLKSVPGIGPILASAFIANIFLSHVEYFCLISCAAVVDCQQPSQLCGNLLWLLIN